MQRSIIVLLLILSGTAASRAQVNTEKMRAFDVEGFATTLSGDIAIESGNADLFEIGLGGRVDYRRGRHYTFITGNLRYGEEGDATFRDQSFAHWRYNYRIVPGLVGEAFTQVQQNGFKLLQLRFLLGSGVRLRYVGTETIKLFQGTTLMYEHENLNADEVTRHPATVSRSPFENLVM